MCGISGIINFNRKMSISAELIKMTSDMKNRGPDDEGFMLFNDEFTTYHGDDSINKNSRHINSSLNNVAKLGFGFRQLKIIDLSNNSHQPMCDISQRFWIVFNGEIYNYKEIKKELIQLGHSFFSNSDTEVIINAYKEWNHNAVNKFNGMFALTIFDTIKNELFIVRDRMGIKPLYYYHTNEHFIFASTISSIISSRLYSPNINYEGLWQNFKFSIAQRPNTCFENIYALEPAHYIKINLHNNTFIKKRYWEIPVNTQDFSLTEKKAVQLIEEELYNAINYRLVADVEVGTFMSGGIDSTTISVLASKINPNIKTLTLGFKDYAEYNEINQAKDTAKLNSLNHIVHNIYVSEIMQNINKIAVAYEEPYRSLSANYLLAKMASDNNLKVVLSGLGGDELFGGYDIYKKIKYWKFLKSNKKIINFLPNIHSKFNKAIQLSKYSDVGQFYSHYYSLFNDFELNKLFKHKQFNTLNTITDLYNNNMTFTDDFEAVSYYNLKSYIGNHQLRAIDQSTMNFSVEGRIPLLDHNFIAAAYKIPSKFKMNGKIQKYIFRQIAKKHIAPSCLEMNKKGISLPIEHWISKELKSLVAKNIQNLKSRNIFNNLEIDAIINSRNPNKIWQLVSTELWLNKFI